MKTAEKITLSIALSIVLLVAFWITSASGLQSGVAQDTTARYYIVVLIDESGSIRGTDTITPNDLGNKRIRFTRFLVQYLRAFYAEDSQVAVAGFVAGPELVFPLSSVSEWSIADFERLEVGLAAVANQQRNQNTEFIPTLGRAIELLEGVPCNERQGTSGGCYVVLFTDGLWQDRENERLISDALRAFDERGIEIVTVIFPGSPPSTRYLEQNYLQTWEMGSTRMISDATSLASRVVYEEILEVLGMHEPLSQLSVAEFERSETITFSVPPFQSLTWFFVIADNNLEETWSVEPDIRPGWERWWIDPPAGEFSVALQSNQSVSETLAYYSVFNQPYPIQLVAQVVPVRQVEGFPVQMLAWFDAGGQIVTGLDSESLEVEVNPGRRIVQMFADSNGRFTGVLTYTTLGTNTVTFNSFLPTAEDQVVEDSFYVGRVPQLELTVGQGGVSPEIVVTVTVQNYETIFGGFTPTLVMESNNQTKVITLEPVHEYSFIGTAGEEFSGDGLVFTAKLPGGRTTEGIYYGDLTISQSYLFPRRVSIRAAFRWVALLALLVALTIFFVREGKKPAFTDPFSPDANKVDVRKAIENMSGEVIAWEEIKKWGERFDEFLE